MPYISGAVIAAAALGYSVYSGERNATMQRRAIRDQKSAQATAELSATRTAADAAEAAAKARKKTIDVALLAGATGAGGVSPTMLTGAGGIGVGKLKLGGGGLSGEVG